MSENDPFAPHFGSEEATVIKPIFGGGARRPPPLSVPEPAAPVPASEAELAAGRRSLSGSNPLIAAALSLLSLASKLRATLSHPAPAELRQSLIKALSGFQHTVLQAGFVPEQTRLASYFLCALMDETILKTPWGSHCQWEQQSLLLHFHKEASASKQFFQMSDQLMRQPAQNLHLLELCYLCLSLGFTGQFQTMRAGAQMLEQHRSELYQTIVCLRGDFEQTLSARWRGLQAPRNILPSLLPAWVAVAFAGAVWVFTYLGLAIALNSASDAPYHELLNLPSPALAAAKMEAEAPAKPPQAPSATARFQSIPGIEVVDDHTLRIRNAFESGQGRIKPIFIPVLQQIATLLAQGRESVLVMGHTDDTSSLSVRFPSNWHLSQARAKHVAQWLLASGELEGRVSFEGRADTEPLAPNDSAEHRASNRRVDLLIH
jgi:type VI secretion system protein ImpK